MTHGRLLALALLAAGRCHAARSEHRHPGPTAAPASAPRACQPLDQPPMIEARDRIAPGSYLVHERLLTVRSPDAPVEAQLQRALSNARTEWEHDFQTTAADVVAEATREAPGLRMKDAIGMDVRCQPAVVTTRLLSVACARSTNLAGAHPNEDHLAYNFVLCAGAGATPLELDALCREPAPCRRTIRALLQRHLARGRPPVTPALTERSTVLDRFVVTRTGLRFFADDEVPFAIRSAAIIDLPFSELGAVLRPDGGLTGLVPSAPSTRHAE